VRVYPTGTMMYHAYRIGVAPYSCLQHEDSTLSTTFG
jgi:hypothetical protein